MFLLLVITAGLDLEKPNLEVSPSVFSVSQGGKEAFRCERVRVSGISRLKLGSFANSFLVSLVPSASIPEKLHGKIEVCFHRYKQN